MTRKTHRSKSHRRRHTRRHTRKNGGGCGCAMRGQWGGRGGLGGADVGHAFTTGASQTLYQSIGTPGLSSGGVRKRTLANRQAGKAAKLAAQAARAAKEAEMLNNKAEKLEEKAEKLEEKAEMLENRAANAAANARATTGLMRANAPAYQPSQNLLNRVALNKGLSNKERELMRMLNENNSPTELNRYNRELNNNFEKIMRQVHHSR